MADEPANPFAYITKLPQATLSGPPFEKHPGIFISAALVEGKGRNVFIEAVHGPNVPQPVYTLNVGGRGSLVFGEQEFRDIASAALALFEARLTGYTKETVTPIDEALPTLPDFMGGEPSTKEG